MAEHATETQETGQRTEELCRQFLAISRRKLTGTLVVTSQEGETKSFLCHNGAIADIDPGREETLLTEILLRAGEVSPRRIKKAQKQAERDGSSLGVALLELETLGEEELLRAIEEGVTQEVTEAFGWDIESTCFHSHEVGETDEGFVSELSEYFDLLADPETLFLEAAQRLDRWDLVSGSFDLLLDVFYATPGTFSYFREPETYPAEIRVLGAIDGYKDIEEVIEESGLDPFTAIEVVRNLVRDGAVELINPVQLFQLATQQEAAGHLEKASRLYRRAMERGLDDFDIELRLAQALESLGRRKEAAASYFRFSSKCLGQLRVDDALRSLRRVVKLGPDQDEAMVKLVDLLVQHNRLDEALDSAMSFADRMEERGDIQAALDLCLKLRETNLRELRLHERIAELAERSGDEELARREKDAIAKRFHGSRDNAEELEEHQKRFVEGDDSLEVRLRLIELHQEQGNHQKAIEHINSVLSLGGKRRVKDLELLMQLHRTMLELNPGDIRSNRFLVEQHLKLDEKDQAVQVLQAWLPELERAGDHEEMAAALRQLVSLDDRLEYRWKIATALRHLGRDDEARLELRDLAHHAMRRREFEQAARALEDILRKEPLDIETRKIQAELYDQRGEKEIAAEKVRELATLEIIAGRVQEAEGWCRQFLVSCPEDAELVDKFGKLCLEIGDEQKAVEQFFKAAKMHLENRNLGLARRAVDRLLKARPEHPEGKALIERLEALERAGERGPAQPEPASPASASEPVSGPSKEPFQNPAPVKTKTSVSGITARLRDLKTGSAPNGEKESGRQATRAVGDIAAKLRSVSSGAGSGTGVPGPGAGAAAPAVESAPSDAPAGDRAGAGPESGGEGAASGAKARDAEAMDGGVQPQSASKALQSAAARLKALSGKPKDDEPHADGPASPAGAVDEETESGEGSNGATSAEPAEGTTPAGDGGGHSPGEAPPTAKLQQKLGGAASRLAALRKQGG